MFSNGTEYECFMEANCYRCGKYKDFEEVLDESKCCPIESKIALASVEGQKAFPYDKLKKNNYMGRYDCTEFQEESGEVDIKALDGQISLFVTGEETP